MKQGRFLRGDGNIICSTKIKHKEQNMRSDNVWSIHFSIDKKYNCGMLHTPDVFLFILFYLKYGNLFLPQGIVTFFIC